MITVTVNGTEVEVAEGTTILSAAKQADAWVPTLCFDDRQAPFGACRVCLVAVEGAPKPMPACTTPCRDGMEIDTTDERSRRVAAAVVELVLSELPERPAAHTELAQVAERLHVSLHEEPRWPGATHIPDHDVRHPYLAFQHELCISCGRCVRACDEVQGAFALTATGRGFSANITAGLDSGRHLPDRRDHGDPATGRQPSWASAVEGRSSTARETAATLRRDHREVMSNEQ
jgi:predicted molibdopterin-dependent oxidoreductase YjgC